jgi:hypothetical protein
MNRFDVAPRSTTPFVLWSWARPDYTAVILTPKQTSAILNSLPLLQQTMVVLDAAQRPFTPVKRHL